MMRGQTNRGARAIVAAELQPCIAGPIVSSLRSMIREKGRWDAVRMAVRQRHPHQDGWLDEPTWTRWVDVERHVALLEATVDVMGVDGMRALGRQRFSSELREGIFASIVRSWLRSFADHPGYLFRITPYLWRAGFRGCGEMTLVDASEGELAYRLDNAPPCLVSSAAWRALLEGFGAGLCEAVGVDGEIRIATVEGEPSVLDLRATWTGRAD